MNTCTHAKAHGHADTFDRVAAAAALATAMLVRVIQPANGSYTYTHTYTHKHLYTVANIHHDADTMDRVAAAAALTAAMSALVRALQPANGSAPTHTPSSEPILYAVLQANLNGSWKKVCAK